MDLLSALRIIYTCFKCFRSFLCTEIEVILITKTQRPTLFSDTESAVHFCQFQSYIVQKKRGFFHFENSKWDNGII